MLWSIGKDSTVLLWLARKAFFGHVPFPLMHIDTGYKIPEMIEYRDRLARRVEAEHDRRPERARRWREGRPSPTATCDRHAVLRRPQDARRSSTRSRGEWPRWVAGPRHRPVRAGARRRAVHRRDRRASAPTRKAAAPRSGTSRPRDQHSDWDVADQPPELWNQFKTDFAPGTHVRIHPLLDWTELNIWEYIERENIPTVSLYFDQGDGKRYRSLGCWPCTKPVESDGQERRRDHRGAAQRQVRQHRRALPAGRRTRKTAAAWRRCGAKGTCDGGLQMSNATGTMRARESDCHGQPGSHSAEVAPRCRHWSR